MERVFVCVCVSLLIQTGASGRCPVSTWVECDNEDEGICESNEDCTGDQICCTVDCITECVDPEGVIVEPPATTAQPPITPPKVVICRKQSDCREWQCCTSTNPEATTGICQDRTWIGYDCHNPRPTGFHHVQCPGPAGIIHPDLCPCGCGDFCAMGPNPRRDAHGGYIGRCPVSTPVDCDSSEEVVCETNDDCVRDRICCTVGCGKECVDPEVTTVKPPVTTAGTPKTTPETPKTTPKGVICRKMSDCGSRQCCTSTDPQAKIGICQYKKRIGYDCHSPYPSGVYFARCPGPAGIVHPDVCPCGCGDFCSMGPNPKRDAHGGYIGMCSFG
ncbi:uncharacterized protein LOC121371459 [Gigantopelta aegis]|uniref:uncharacterized protein LOC121371459 n=1 Tax=Gigantopelta aegis TaxID=1735272 RepID=UPI001B88AB8E|nr:uncharacterized protein LOC121371459 [Gigantopelta aegis]